MRDFTNVPPENITFMGDHDACSRLLPLARQMARRAWLAGQKVCQMQLDNSSYIRAELTNGMARVFIRAASGCHLKSDIFVVLGDFPSSFSQLGNVYKFNKDLVETDILGRGTNTRKNIIYSGSSYFVRPYILADQTAVRIYRDSEDTMALSIPHFKPWDSSFQTDLAANKKYLIVHSIDEGYPDKEGVLHFIPWNEFNLGSMVTISSPVSAYGVGYTIGPDAYLSANNENQIFLRFGLTDANAGYYVFVCFNVDLDLQEATVAWEFSTTSLFSYEPYGDIFDGIAVIQTSNETFSLYDSETGVAVYENVLIVPTPLQSFEDDSSVVQFAFRNDRLYVLIHRTQILPVQNQLTQYVSQYAIVRDEEELIIDVIYINSMSHVSPWDDEYQGFNYRRWISLMHDQRCYPGKGEDDE